VKRKETERKRKKIRKNVGNKRPLLTAMCRGKSTSSICLIKIK
jgi:hypothetical protein